MVQEVNNQRESKGPPETMVLTYPELLSDADGDPEIGEDGMLAMTDELSNVINFSCCQGEEVKNVPGPGA